MTIATTLKELRRKHKLTQKELARQSGVSFSFINQVENGKETIQLDVLNKVLDLFGYEVGVVPKSKEERSFNE